MTRFAEIEGFPGYLVTDDGRVLSRRKNFGLRDHYRDLKPSRDAKGYPGLTLCGPNRERAKKRVHRLVAEAFIPNPENLPCVRHLDGVSDNNRADNLAWGTHQDNERDKIGHGTYEHRRNGKLSEEQRDLVRGLSILGLKQAQIAAFVGVSRPTVSRLLSGATWGCDTCAS